MQVEKTCPVCGKSFAPKRQSRQKYCSPECRIAALVQAGQIRTGAVCAFCGGTFSREKDSQAKYCSQECRQAAYRDSISIRAERTCPVCGEVFTCKRCSNQKTCSRACAGKLRGNAFLAVADNPGYTRKCHDCGKPTNDYRCGECRLKWKMKHHVAEHEQGFDGYACI